MATLPPRSRGTHSGEESIELQHPWVLGGPIVGRYAYGYITPTFPGSP